MQTREALQLLTQTLGLVRTIPFPAGISFSRVGFPDYGKSRVINFEVEDLISYNKLAEETILGEYYSTVSEFAHPDSNVIRETSVFLYTEAAGILQNPDSDSDKIPLGELVIYFDTYNDRYRYEATYCTLSFAIMAEGLKVLVLTMDGDPLSPSIEPAMVNYFSELNDPTTIVKHILNGYGTVPPALADELFIFLMKQIPGETICKQNFQAVAKILNKV